MATPDLTQLPKPILDDEPDLLALYDLAWSLAARHVKVTRGRAHMDAAWDPDRNYQWVWDTCFMALYCRYAADQFPGVESLDNFYDHQAPDGHIGMTYDMTTDVEPWPNRINPPLFAWVEWEHYMATGDDSRLARVVEPIEKLMAWIDANRRTAPHRRRRATDGPMEGRGESTSTYQLYYFEDCGSSGMDDAPRAPRLEQAGRFFDWIDLSSQMALSFNCLAKIHRVLGHGDKAQHWSQRAGELGGLINDELWCPATRFYHDRMLPTNFVASKTVAGFWPMVAGICPAARVDELVAHLRNPAEFARPIPVPSLSADDPNYDPRGTYWVGGVWAPTNYMITRGLTACGRPEAAQEIAAAYLRGLVRTWKEHQPATLWECNSPEAARPGLAAYRYVSVKPDFVGWSGLGPIAMLIENILGIEVNAPAGLVHWRLTPRKGRQGICRLTAGRGVHVDLIATAPRTEGRVKLHTRSDRPIKLRIALGSLDQTITLDGEQDWTL